MKGIRRVNGASATVVPKAQKRRLKVAPVTRAVRAALAASAAVLALAGPAPAIAGDCTAPVNNTVRCNGDFTDTLNFAVEDLTLVVGDESPSTIAPPPGSPGILADWNGNIGVTSSADIQVQDADGIHAVGNGDIDIFNDGSIGAYSFGQAIGIYAYSDGGDVSIANEGTIFADSWLGLADGIFASGADVDVANGADGLIVALGYDWAAGIEAQGDDAATVVNEGIIYARSSGAGEVFGVYASGGEAAVENSGNVYAHGYDQSTGIYALGDTAVSIDNSGGVFAGYYNDGYSSSYATALFAVSGGAGGAVGVENSGQLQAISFAASSGVDARASGAGGKASVVNSGDILSVTLAYGAVATGIAASGDGDAVVDNSGDIGVYSNGTSEGIVSSSFNGQAGIVNSGDVTAYSSAFNYYASYGLVAFATNGGASVDNSGNVDVKTLFIGAGIDASGPQGVSVDNSGVVSVDAWRQFGVRAISNGDVSVENSGSIDVSYSHEYDYIGRSYGVLGASVDGDVSVANDGSISSFTTGLSIGVFAQALQGDVSVSGGGDVHASTWHGTALGIYANGLRVDVRSGGDIEARGYSSAYAAGILASGVDGAAVVVSGGDIGAVSIGDAVGVTAYASAGDATIENGGSVHAYTMYGTSVQLMAIAPVGTAAITNSGQVGDGGFRPGSITGMLALGASAEVANDGDVLVYGVRTQGIYAGGSDHASVDNGGSIDAFGMFDADGIYAVSGGATTVDNAGTIEAGNRVNLAIGIRASGETVDIANSGTVHAFTQAGYDGVSVGILAQAYGDVALHNAGSISSGSGIAAYLYSATGSVTIGNSGDLQGAIITSGGDDAFANGSGGEWHVDNGLTDFGGGDDAVANGAGGTIHLADGGIFLGTSGAAGNRFGNAGTIRTSGYGIIDMGRGVALVPSLNPLPLVNDGIIDFVDGSPDDLLVVVGDLGGDGAINLDLSVLNGGADLLYVDGSVVDGSTQTINLSIDGMPTGLVGDASPVVMVTGNVPSGSFVGGDVLNFDPSNFLDLGVSVGTAQAGGLNVVSAAVQVDGLNGTGVLAASVAQGAHSLVNSAIGTLRQRTGVRYPLADGESGLSPWVRLYTEKGDVAPVASGVGAGSDFGFEQENRGREMGMGFTLGNASFGILAGNADGTQRIDGVGRDRLDLHGAGLYATWTGPRFYLDVSHRWMDFDARLDSPTGERETSGNAKATNIEAGFTGWALGGIDIVPQVQYTRSKIDNIEAISGSAMQMEIDGGVSERGRVGVAVSRSFAGRNGVEWTPYGGLSAVREFDGATGFTVAGTFTGSTSVEGTSALAELGLGVRKGGLSATAGLNWADGGALDSMRGGQLVIRYTW